jgi:hypothetical protein
MLAPTRNTQTTVQKLVVDWIALEIPENGYSTILSYNLVWDAGSNGQHWTNLIGYETDTLVKRYQVATGLEPGNWYQLKVKAKNAFGWSDYSDVLEIKAATWPEAGTAVTTQVDEVSGDIQITWVEPYDNADTITQYEVLIESRLDGTWVEICSDEGITRSCMLSMNDLISTYGY